MDNLDLTYEDAIEKLNKILKDLEEDNCSLEESIKKFTQGMDLYNYCNSLLSKAEGQVSLLLKDNQNNVEEVDFSKEVKNDFL